MTKKQKKYTTTIINNVRVTSATKREFYGNKAYYKDQGIRSAQRLQELKNIQTRIRQAETRTRQKAIKAAYEKEIYKYEELGYSLQEFIDIDKYFQKRNKVIQKAVKKGKILETAAYSIPITTMGTINIDRLNRLLTKAKRKINDIQKQQKNYIIHNLYMVFGDDEYYTYFAKLSTKVSNHQLVTLLDAVGLDFFYRYNIEDFDDDAQDAFWYGYRQEVHSFHNLIIRMADLAGDYDTLGVFGI
ncbi:MAG: hypothetical protein J6S85_25125 [Methanobrevibacter sp.]|nr:hypothetical protein [Methanobrevibacter sp.]